MREGETHSGCRTTYLETTYTLNLFKVSRLEEQRDPVSLHLLFLNRYQGWNIYSFTEEFPWLFSKKENISPLVSVNWYQDWARPGVSVSNQCGYEFGVHSRRLRRLDSCSRTGSQQPFTSTLHFTPELGTPWIRILPRLLSIHFHFKCFRRCLLSGANVQVPHHGCYPVPLLLYVCTVFILTWTWNRNFPSSLV